ncbi:MULTISPECIES: DUF1707 SHOCT-like domain-containing protein [Rhodococcus]|jgi:hypothetical protein|uniref:DUF1707 domain-containing protein n=2 Tax=Nocardiaceae TaxID=85025 RepID=A0ABU4BSS3_RHOGO|nr:MULTISPECIES: DUF1707 domain-containing protein [Rhodococcus]MCE4267137.1 DUF1707 domain-containing protein [Rhodococcus globerulus]MDV6267144.1 DUF1707 domain-containing protein [Rhodococcus globerulus]MDV8066146.1 DUF1707 domain-containing protein [Rhodococcus sp. IEGM 1366]QXW03943.1 DUF1707 domain-containing protein [Rhodococcus globerulus]ROZ48924.1 DUF1707 domain-containing protein [Rhodococcus sp. WS3]
MADVPDIRIGTAEREQALTALTEHFAAGRLTVSEFDERSGIVTAATTRSELAPVFKDLPDPVPSPAATSASVPARKFDPDWSGRIMAVIPILALILFFVTGTWLWFLAIPLAGALLFGTDKERKKKRRDDRNS